MDEFNSRTNAQRTVLTLVNETDLIEPLFGLSKNAIDRWQRVNLIDVNAEVTALLIRISLQLMFLANKSQQQITDEYRRVSAEVDALISELSKNDFVKNRRIANR